MQPQEGVESGEGSNVWVRQGRKDLKTCQGAASTTQTLNDMVTRGTQALLIHASEVLLGL